MKKTISILLALVITLSSAFIAFTASGYETGKCGDNLTYTISDGTLTISGTGAMYHYNECVDPLADIYDSDVPYEYSDIAGLTAYDRCISPFSGHFNKVIIEEGVTSIGAMTFYNCEIDYLDIASTVRAMGNSAFNCVIPEVNIHDVGSWNNCTFGMDLYTNQVEYSEWGMSNEKYTYYGGSNPISKTTVLKLNGVELNDLVYPEGTKVINGISFNSCKTIKSVYIPDGVTDIKDYAFINCGVQSLRLPASLQSIGKNVFKKYEFHNTSLKSVDFNNLKFWCETDSEILWDAKNAVKTYCGNQIINLEIPSDVEIIREFAFSNGTSLEKVIIKNPDCVIESGAFPSDIVIYGYVNSTAEQYANNKGITFKNILEFDIDEPDDKGGTTTVITPEEEADYSGWFNDGEFWYYGGKTGEPITGWLNLNGMRYCLDENGRLLLGENQINGDWYISHNTTGAIQKGMVLYEGKTYITSLSDGKMLFGLVQYNGNKYITSKSTGEVLYGKVSCNGLKYIMSRSTGEMLYGRVSCNGKVYICSKADGHIFIDQNVTCNGIKYSCDKNGVATRI